MKVINLYVIYFNPMDYPGKFVLRVHQVRLEEELFLVGRAAQISDTLEGIRTFLPLHVTPIGRYEHDDPVILEVWI
jgi:hypothetical protein